MNKIIAKDKTNLLRLIKNEMKLNGDQCSLNHIDVSSIKNMSKLFYESKFNRDISQWDVSNVEDMEAIFAQSEFNTDISNWNVSKVKNMKAMFYMSEFD